MIDISEDHVLVNSVSSSSEESKMTIRRVPDQPGIAARILGPVAAAGISIDVIVQNTSREGLTDFTFTVPRECAEQAHEVLRQTAAKIAADAVERNDDIAKVTLVGAGMQSQPGVASKAFQALSDEGINIQMISTSDIKITIVVSSRYEELAVRALHRAFFPEA